MRQNSLSLMAFTALTLTLAACSGDTPSPEIAASSSANAQDPRFGLKAGTGDDAGQAIWNLEHETLVKMPDGFYAPDMLWAPAVEFDLMRRQAAGEKIERAPTSINFANTDLAFTGNRVIMGNFHGLNIIEMNEDQDPEIVLSLVCPGGQGDVSVYGDLVFHSVEQGRGRLDCGSQGTKGRTNKDRFRGVRIFDVSDIGAPKQIAAVQTCRGSHTHTLVPHPTDDNILYVYVSGTSGVRSADELEGCTSGEPEDNPDTALYRIDIIEVPLDAPEKAKVINSPRIFSDKVTGAINGLWKGGQLEEKAQKSSKTTACHDITVYPAYNIAAGACSGNGILLDIKDPADPQRIAEISDPNFAYWHSATFSNDAKKVLFTDEWGGGVAARCRAKDPEKWGANIVAHITQDGLQPRGFFKIPGSQTDTENCVAHNGSLIPVPGRDIMVQGWYSGGLSITDFTNSDEIYEIAFFDRGPLDTETLYLGGYWAAYWHNGKIYAPEITRGLDVFSLKPSEHLTAAEIEAAGLVRFETANTQTQEKLEWPAHPAVIEALADQLERGSSVSETVLTDIRSTARTWRSRALTSVEAGNQIDRLKAATEAATGTDKARLEMILDQIKGAAS